MNVYRPAGLWARRHIVLRRVALVAGIERGIGAVIVNRSRRRRPELTVSLFHPTLKLGNILRNCEVSLTTGPVDIVQPSVEALQKSQKHTYT